MTRLGVRFAVLALAVAGCGSVTPPQLSADPPLDTPGPPAPEASCAEDAQLAEAPVYAFFHCADADPLADPWPVPRDAHGADPVSRLDAAMTGLVGGPTEDERAAGYSSFFSEATAGAVRSVEIDEDGVAIVDLEDVRPFMNNASTSAGAQGLLSQLNATVFQIQEVMAVEYRIEGSCAAFWEWLQSTCTVVERP